MKTKRRVSSIASGLIATTMLAAFAGCTSQLGQSDVSFSGGRFGLELPDSTSLESEERTQFSDELARSIEVLAIRLRHTAIVEALETANTRHESLTLEDILELDHRWQNAPADSPFITGNIDAACSDVLKGFQQAYPEYVEIFVTDRRGLNVCQTNKTTDYYQADEEWWIQTNESTEHEPIIAPLVHDQSADTYAVPVYLPVSDHDRKRMIGIAKTLVRKRATTE
jgi:hypothetical protein